MLNDVPTTMLLAYAFSPAFLAIIYSVGPLGRVQAKGWQEVIGLLLALATSIIVLSTLGARIGAAAAPVAWAAAAVVLVVILKVTGARFDAAPAHH
jgi:Na+/H+ antiporter NhaD/arsenite permease-like protein